MSDLPKDAPGLEVGPIEPTTDGPVYQPSLDNAQFQGDELSGKTSSREPEAAAEIAPR